MAHRFRSMLGIAFGDTATWVLAIGTLGTFYVSLRLLRRAREDRRVEQARLVSAWSLDMTEDPDGWRLTYIVRNNSEEPVYEVILNAMCGVRGTFVRWLGTLGPAERRRVTILLPGAPRSEDYRPSLGFVDSAGRRWLRDGLGRLTEPGARGMEALLNEDAGAYGSVEDHPTLHLDRPGYELRGIRLDGETRPN
jgi:hypothetical protein